jgi:prophage antirepressor-like protein
MNEIIPFSFNFEGKRVRLIERNGVPWWFLADVYAVLGLGNPSQAAARLEPEEKSTLTQNEGGKFNDLGSIGAMPRLVN